MVDVMYQIAGVLSALIQSGMRGVYYFSTCIRFHPLLLAFVVLSVVGLGIGFIKRIIRL